MVGGMPMEEFMHWYIAADGTKLLEDFRHETQQLHPLVTGMGSTEFFLHSHKPVRNIADLKGMKIRTAGPWADILKMVGASATVIPPADIFTALERRGDRRDGVHHARDQHQGRIPQGRQVHHHARDP